MLIARFYRLAIGPAPNYAPQGSSQLLIVYGLHLVLKLAFDYSEPEQVLPGAKHHLILVPVVRAYAIY